MDVKERIFDFGKGNDNRKTFGIVVPVDLDDNSTIFTAIYDVCVFTGVPFMSLSPMELTVVMNPYCEIIVQ